MILPLLFLDAEACLPVHEPMLRAVDLTAADSRFAEADPQAAIGYAPVPGARRVLSDAEMSRLAKRFGIEAEMHSVCFEWPMKKLDAEAVKEAMLQVIPEAEVTVINLPNFDVPEGKLVFSLASLPKNPPARAKEPVIWRGSIEYSPGRRVPIWAKVLVARPENEIPLLVARGESVQVAVQAGSAEIKVSARAESAAGLGQPVKLRNPKSGKLFEARVTGKGSATLVAPALEQTQ